MGVTEAAGLTAAQWILLLSGLMPGAFAAQGALGGDPCHAAVSEGGFLQHQGALKSTGDCTAEREDPYADGSMVPCCPGLQACNGEWRSNGTRFHLCLPSCGLKAQNGLSICPNPVRMGSSSIWNVAPDTESCYSPGKGIRGDVGFACADASGFVDETSIFVDMGSTNDKVGCFVWQTDGCQYSMKDVRQIDFDFEWEACENLWMAPLWTFSFPWAPITGRQGISGEIDFVEECEVPGVNTNLGCYNAGQGGGCIDAEGWGHGHGSNGPRHMTMTLDPEGNLEVHLCTIHSQNCRRVARYANYLGIVYPTTGGRNNLYKFVSDVFNDQPRDPGWSGCKAVQNPATTCKYAITNIKIVNNSDAYVFPDTRSKCYVLNAEAAPPFSPDENPAVTIFLVLVILACLLVFAYIAYRRSECFRVALNDLADRAIRCCEGLRSVGPNRPARAPRSLGGLSYFQRLREAPGNLAGFAGQQFQRARDAVASLGGPAQGHPREGSGSGGAGSGGTVMPAMHEG